MKTFRLMAECILDEEYECGTQEEAEQAAQEAATQALDFWAVEICPECGEEIEGCCCDDPF